MGLYELNKKITFARANGYKFNQINKLTIKIYSTLSKINICYYLKHRIAVCHRNILLKISQNKENLQNFCNDRRNLFHFACRQWYSYNNPQSDMV